MKTLIEQYTSLLGSVGLVVDAEGFISSRLPGSETSKPWMIDNRRSVLPIKDQLNVTDWSTRIGFHPFLQKIEEGESRSVDKFRDRMNVYADFMHGAFLLNLAKLATEKEKHLSLTPAQAIYLGPFSDADDKFLKFVLKMVTTARPNKKGFEFLRFSLVKGRIYDGKKRSRVAVLHFPLYEALPVDGSGTTILDHKLRGKDVKMLRSIYEFMFPGIGEKETWEVGSDSLIAASMESLMQLYAKFVNIHNNAVATLGTAIEANEELPIVNDWQEGMSNLSLYHQQIQSIPWLEGVKTSATPTTNAPAMIGATVPVQAPMQQQQIHQPAPVVQLSQPMQAPNTFQLNPQVASNQPKPRFTLGVAPVVTESSAPQITPQQVHQFHQPQQQVHQIGSVYVDPAAEQARLYQQQQLQLQQQQLQLQQQQLLQQQQQAMKVPESARLVNGQLYIPVEGNGVSQVPVGALSIEGKLYMPLTPSGGQPQFQQQQQPMNQFGMVQQQPNQISHPSQLPNLSPQEVAYFTANPVMFQNYLAQMQQSTLNQFQQQQQVRQQAVPRYLRNALAEAQQLQQQQQFNGGFLSR